MSKYFRNKRVGNCRDATKALFGNIDFMSKFFKLLRILFISSLFLSWVTCCSTTETVRQGGLFQEIYNDNEVNAIESLLELSFQNKKVNFFCEVDLKVNARKDSSPWTKKEVQESSKISFKGQLEVQEEKKSVYWNLKIYEMVNETLNEKSSTTPLFCMQYKTDKSGNFISGNVSLSSDGYIGASSFFNFLMRLTTVVSLADRQATRGAIILKPVQLKDFFVDPILAIFPDSMQGDFALVTDTFQGTRVEGIIEKESNHLLATSDHGTLLFKDTNSSDWIYIFITGKGLLEEDSLLFRKRNILVKVHFNYPGQTSYVHSFNITTSSVEI